MKEEAVDRHLRGENELNEELSQEEIMELDILKEGIRMSVLQSKIELLKKIEANISNQTKSSIVDSNRTGRILNINQVMAIAASLSLLIAAGLWFVNKGNVSNEQLYASYYNKIPGISESMRSNDGTQSTYDKAISDYNANNYEKALAGLGLVNTPSALFYKGIVQMELNNYEGATETFLQYKTLSDGEEEFPVNYYLALCQLKKDNINAAKSSLRMVNPDNTAFYKKAQELLEKL